MSKEYWQTSENEEFWSKYDQQRCEAIRELLSKYSVINGKSQKDHGLEVAVSLFGFERVSEYLESLTEHEEETNI